METNHPGAESSLERLRATGFRRELTPTWLSFACLLNGHRPPELDAGFRYVHIGCGAGHTTAVVGAVHPDADVWAWSNRPGDLESTARICRSADLSNVRIHERPGLPPDLGGDMADLIVVEDVLTSASDQWRSELFAAVGDNLRPGGLLCVTYRTTAAWSEIVPVQRVMRRVAQRHGGHPDDLVPTVLGFLDQLRIGGARHLTERPVVAEWLDELAHTDPAIVEREWLQDEFRPMSHPQVAAALDSHGCTFVGSALINEGELSSELAEVVGAAPSPVLREAYRDLATRPKERMDLFRRGGAPLTRSEHQALLNAAELVPLTGADDGETSGDKDEGLRASVGAGRAHPASVHATSAAVESSRALEAVFAAANIDIVPLPAIGSAARQVTQLTTSGGPDSA